MGPGVNYLPATHNGHLKRKRESSPTGSDYMRISRRNPYAHKDGNSPMVEIQENSDIYRSLPNLNKCLLLN